MEELERVTSDYEYKITVLTKRTTELERKNEQLESSIKVSPHFSRILQRETEYDWDSRVQSLIRIEQGSWNDSSMIIMIDSIIKLRLSPLFNPNMNF